MDLTEGYSQLKALVEPRREAGASALRMLVTNNADNQAARSIHLTFGQESDIYWSGWRKHRSRCGQESYIYARSCWSDAGGIYLTCLLLAQKDADSNVLNDSRCRVPQLLRYVLLKQGLEGPHDGLAVSVRGGPSPRP